MLLAVTIWKPHSLAKPHADQLDLRIGDKVRSTADVDGVPEGTEGKVILANGFNWQRYRVLFTDGTELGDLDQRHIEPIGRAAKRLAKLPSSAEHDAVLTELGDIGRVSRQTLHDIREAVSGYRRPTLAIEVITARNALEAAGIALEDDAELTLRSGTFDPEAEAVLGRTHRTATGRELESFMSPSYLDTRVHALYDRVPALCYGPVSRNIHGFDEAVNLASVQRITGAIALFVAEWCGTEERAAP